jgi:hypothetical protein
MTERRQLFFAGLEEVMPEVERLAAGYKAVGQWSLGQICNHLTASFNFVTVGVSGSSPSNAPEDPRLALIRTRFFRAGRFPDGKSAPVSELVPGTGLDDRAEAEALCDALARFDLATGPCRAHPFLGSMTKEEWSRFQCLHAAHHLGFVVPVDSGR